jgi:signal transduction histidine kinase
MEATLNQLLEILENQEHAYSDSEQVDLSLLLDDKLSTFRRLNQSRNIEFEIEEQVVIQSHLDLLNRAFDNLLINIHKHTPETVPVYVSLKRRSDQVEIEFHDGGSGLEKLDDGFEIRPFKRFDKSRSRETGGSGLGLSIVESSVKLLGGVLLFRRSHLGGLAVRIELPISTSALH